MPRVSDEHLAARREQILQAAWTRFSRNGFHATTMADVIAASGLSAGAVYRYFRSKEDLVRAIALRALEPASEALRDLLRGDVPPHPAEVVRLLIGSVENLAVSTGDDVPRVALQAWAEALRSPTIMDVASEMQIRLRDQLAEAAARAQHEGYLSPGADPKAVGQVMLSMIIGYVVQRLITRDVDSAGYADAVLEVFGSRDGALPVDS
jgi:AcrR family transcriptional regulator